MEGHELQRMRRAHRLSVEQLAKILNVSPGDVSGWEAPPGDPLSQPIDSTTRQQILRQLALWRDRQEMERLPAQPRVLPAGFTPGHLLAFPVRAK